MFLRLPPKQYNLNFSNSWFRFLNWSKKENKSPDLQDKTIRYTYLILSFTAGSLLLPPDIYTEQEREKMYALKIKTI